MLRRCFGHVFPYHPWDERYISLHLVDFCIVNVGKYTVRPMDGMGLGMFLGSKLSAQFRYDWMSFWGNASIQDAPGKSGLCERNRGILFWGVREPIGSMGRTVYLPTFGSFLW